jgi:ParB-like chromosome segregation protein Spo0J
LHTLIINPAELNFSAWNTNTVSPEDQKKLEESLRRNGQFRPIIVYEAESGGYVIIGGEHTTRAAISLGWDEIAIYNLGPISEIKAKEISVLDNGRYGHDDATELANLLAEIAELDELKTFLPLGDEDLTAIFATQDIDLDDLELGDDEAEGLGVDDTPPKTHQLLRFKVPLADSEYVEDKINAVMSQQGYKSLDSLTNAGDALVHILNNWKPQ